MMLEQARTHMIGGVLAAMLAAGGVYGQPQILADDGFGDGDRDNDSVTEGVATDPADVGVPWYLARGFSDLTLSVADDTGGIGNGSALDVVMMTDSTRPIIFSFPERIALDDDGDRLSIQLAVRITESPIDVTDGGMFPGRNGDRRFRMGFYNNQGTPEPMMDMGAPSLPEDPDPTGDDTGYLSLIDVGTGEGNTVGAFGDKADGILGGSAVSLGATSADPSLFLDNSTHTFGFSLTRQNDEIVAAVFFDGLLVQSGSASAQEVMDFNLPSEFDYVAFGTSAVSLDYRVDDILVEFTPAPTAPVTMDGFEDGDWNNDGALDPFIGELPDVNDPSDIGFSWIRGTGSGGFEVGVLDDSQAGGIGTGNAVNPFSSTSSTRAIVASIEPVELAQPGDSVSFSFDYRNNFNPPNSDRRFRFGIHDDNGTPASESDIEQGRDDSGYMAQFDTGSENEDAPDDDSTATVRGDLANGILSGGTRSLGGTSTDQAFALDDLDPHRLELRITRRTDEMLGRDVNDVELFFDGMLVTAGVDSGGTEADGPSDPTAVNSFTFNQIAIGTNSVAFIDYNIDNVEVTFTPADNSPGPLADGFEDGDRDNDGAAEGPINDPADVGLAWFQSRGTADYVVTVVDDAGGIDQGNAMSLFPLTSSTRAVSATFDDITLGQVGDFISLAADVRLLGSIPDSDRRFRWGLHHNSGTPVIQDGGPTVTNDDVGYIVQMDTGVPSGTNATIRGDVDPGSFLGGASRSFGANSEDPALVLDDNDPHRLELILERVFDAGLGQDVIEATFIFDGIEAASGVDNATADPPNNPNVPLTFNFNQATFGTSGVNLVNILIDRVEINTNVLPCEADLNGDGVADFADLVVYLGLAASGDPSADLNGDTNIDVNDLNQYLGLLEDGCGSAG